MSTQFRSRIKSVVNYGTESKSVGTCCYTNGTSESLSFYECFVKNGTFITGTDASCPNQGELKTCYACAFLTLSQKLQVIENSQILDENPTWGTKTVTECECFRVGGNLSKIDPNNVTRDIRIPKACCYLEYNANGFPIGITCENVCSEKECSLKGITFENGTLKNTPVYTSNSLCSEVECSENNIPLARFAEIVAGSSSYATFDIGACFNLTKNSDGYTYDCSLDMLHNCSGYWISPDFGNNNTIFCNTQYAPQVPIVESGRIIEPESMSEASFDALNLEIGDEYHGGIYIGKFQPNSPASKVYGSLNLTNGVEMYYDDKTPRETYSKWALIVDKNEYYTNLISEQELEYSIPSTSNSDGFYNTYGDKQSFFGLNFKTLNTVKGFVRRGFADYYLPSIIEIYFLANAIRNNSTLLSKLGNPQKLTSSSIFFEDITSNKTKNYKFNNNIFVYGQVINTNNGNFGKTMLVSGGAKSNLRFFRKVILT